VAQIIEEAEVSESTFFRYFPTKADVVLFDGLDALIVVALRDQPQELGVVHALRAALLTVFGRLTAQEATDQRERIGLIFSGSRVASDPVRPTRLHHGAPPASPC
jgi:AcrR family transcriptional regulator